MRGRMPRELRSIQILIQMTRSIIPGPLWIRYRMCGQGLSSGLLASEHIGLCCWCLWTSRRRKSRSRHRTLPECGHRDRIRLGQEGQDDAPDLHRRARLDRCHSQKRRQKSQESLMWWMRTGTWQRRFRTGDLV